MLDQVPVVAAGKAHSHPMLPRVLSESQFQRMVIEKLRASDSQKNLVKGLPTPAAMQLNQHFEACG